MGLLLWKHLAVNRERLCFCELCVFACWKCACMVFPERDENDLLRTWLIKGTSSCSLKLCSIVQGSCNKHSEPSVASLTIIQLGMLSMTLGSLRLRCQYSWSLAKCLLRLRTLMCILSVIARCNAISACVRSWLNRYVTRWSICSCSSDTATVNDISCNDLIYYNIVLFSRDLKLIIWFSVKQSFVITRSRENYPVILLSWESRGN